ncbi:MAG: PAS domain-containing protein [Deltaproteobacteria bacterium]|nr:PAS domain-containing protein [Deltaproteobacteria bacterium]
MKPTPTGRERTFGEEEIIVSKTDTSGRITYANDVFLRIAGYTQAEVIGQPHSLIRHPDMPRCVFQLLWTTIASGKEIFAYVVNMAKNGDHYWVLAHVTPTFDGRGKIVGYHSNRRAPERSALAVIEPLYRQLLAEERLYSAKAEQIARSSALLDGVLQKRGIAYDELMFTL